MESGWSGRSLEHRAFQANRVYRRPVRLAPHNGFESCIARHLRGRDLRRFLAGSRLCSCPIPVACTTRVPSHEPLSAVRCEIPPVAGADGGCGGSAGAGAGRARPPRLPDEAPGRRPALPRAHPRRLARPPRHPGPPCRAPTSSGRSSRWTSSPARAAAGSSSSPSSPRPRWRSASFDHLGLDSRKPPLARAQAPPDVLDRAPSHDGAEPVCPDWVEGPPPAGPSLASAAECYPLPGYTSRENVPPIGSRLPGPWLTEDPLSDTKV